MAIAQWPGRPAPGPFGGWNLTDTSRSADDESLQRELDSPGVRPIVHGRYEQFLKMNPTLLQICSDWQMQRIGNTPVLNDHTDLDYDINVMSRLARINEAAQDLCRELAEPLPRFGVYQGRFSFAIEQAMAGNHDYVADGLHSYHSV